MRHLLTLACFALAIAASNSASADIYNFQVLYTGGGNAVLDAGSDNPVGATLDDGDQFAWSIKAQGGDSWRVETGGDFFPLMAFEVAEYGLRYGDFTLTLRNDNVDVFTMTETNAVNFFVHLGSNTVTLAQGLVFDEMSLDYLLIQATEDPQNAPDPGNLASIGSTIQGLLPIFGAPELNVFSPGITYGTRAVPEPHTMALLGSGIAILAAAQRRRRASAFGGSQA